MQTIGQDSSAFLLRNLAALAQKDLVVTSWLIDFMDPRLRGDDEKVVFRYRLKGQAF
jgi:hypothetical protein